VPSNLSSRLIYGSFGWGCVLETHPKEVETWLVYKWTIDSRNVWFSYSRFLKTIFFFYGCKHDYEHHEIWHQQDVSSPQLLEKKSFEEKG
jgi:hypothetical protein